MAPKFPKLKADGSFCVEVTLHLHAHASEDLGRRVGAWFAEWVLVNRHWSWSPAKERNGIVDYFDEFQAAPQVTASEARLLRFSVHGRPGAKWWKDLLVLRLLKDLSSSFREIESVAKIRDCPRDA
jgi:hypothetical protein